MPFEFGDVILVPFPFTSQVASKKRPAVIVSSRGYNTAKPDLVVMAVTSQLHPSPQLDSLNSDDQNTLRQTIRRIVGVPRHLYQHDHCAIAALR
jgi:mRNA-degrading endonuclease toxin of MazEF toxin-antitoxin module